MVLVVETGAGLPNADSYNSVQEVLDLLTLYGEQAAFAALTSNPSQEQVCRRATRALDTDWQHRGTKETFEQALEYPRVGARDDDGFVYPDNVLPKNLKLAHALLCAAAAASPNQDLQPTQTSPGSIQAESIAVAGVVSRSRTYAGSKSQEAYYRKVDAVLKELVESSDVLERA